ncbi:MAG: isoprenylcysteine carboxylmethyltransferase family protein [Sandaracinaceae bacterium]|nr:isoprenylcysteine carboxylmethyltransferase family protein [Sandaracinaceae bacterium]
MNDMFSRYAVLAGVFTWGAAGLILPMIRHRLKTGDGTGFVLQQVTDPVGKAVGVAMTAQALLVGSYAIAFAALGSDALDAFAWVPGWCAYVGVGAFALAITICVTAQAQMGRSWRMCVDEGHTQLVSSGLFGVVRNPIYTANLILLGGVLLVAPSPWSVMLLYAASVFLAIQTRLEEAHLRQMHGAEYAAYCARVGRFFPGVGLITAGPAMSAGVAEESR